MREWESAQEAAAAARCSSSSSMVNHCVADGCDNQSCWQGGSGSRRRDTCGSDGPTLVRQAGWLDGLVVPVRVYLLRSKCNARQRAQCTQLQLPRLDACIISAALPTAAAAVAVTAAAVRCANSVDAGSALPPGAFRAGLPDSSRTAVLLLRPSPPRTAPFPRIGRRREVGRRLPCGTW